MPCFRLRFLAIQDLFKRITKLVESRKVTVNRSEYKALKHELQAVSKHNIDGLEKRVKAMWVQVSVRLRRK